MSDDFLSQESPSSLNNLLFCENWLVDDRSSCQPYFPNLERTYPEPYRLYHFLSDLDRILDSITDDMERIKAIIPLVRQLLISSEWLHNSYIEPSSETGWSVKMLYQEPDYPITVQTVAWLPGKVSPIHNHAAWGIVALIGGEEKNTFWRKAGDSQYPHRIEKVAEKVLTPGDIIGFTSEAMHCVEPLGDRPTITFNLYGVTNFKQRYEFDAVRHTRKLF